MPAVAPPVAAILARFAAPVAIIPQQRANLKTAVPIVAIPHQFHRGE